jgi:hypothetical protein
VKDSPTVGRPSCAPDAHLHGMDDDPRPRLVLVRGGRPDGETPPEDARDPALLRLIPGGQASEVQAGIDRAILAARQIRLEIQARIARALEEHPT